MALAVVPSRQPRNHQLVDATLPNATTWTVLTVPSWAKRVQLINHGSSTIYLSTDVADGAAGSGGVALPGSGGVYDFSAGGSGGVYIAVRHAVGATYDIGVALWDHGNA